MRRTNPLFEAAELGNLDAVEDLVLNKKMNVDECDSSMNISPFEFRLQQRAQPKRGYTCPVSPIVIALINEHWYVAEFLMGHSKRLELPSDQKYDYDSLFIYPYAFMVFGYNRPIRGELFTSLLPRLASLDPIFRNNNHDYVTDFASMNECRILFELILRNSHSLKRLCECAQAQRRLISSDDTIKHNLFRDIQFEHFTFYLNETRRELSAKEVESALTALSYILDMNLIDKTLAVTLMTIIKVKLVVTISDLALPHTLFRDSQEFMKTTRELSDLCYELNIMSEWSPFKDKPLLSNENKRALFWDPSAAQRYLQIDESTLILHMYSAGIRYEETSRDIDQNPILQILIRLLLQHQKSTFIENGVISSFMYADLKLKLVRVISKFLNLTLEEKMKMQAMMKAKEQNDELILSFKSMETRVQSEARAMQEPVKSTQPIRSGIFAPRKRSI